MHVCSGVCVRQGACTYIHLNVAGHVSHEKGGRTALSSSTLPLPAAPASLAAVCQLGPIHHWMVAWQLGPCSANQDLMQQELSPWYIKERDRVLLQLCWFCFSVIHVKGRVDVGPYHGASESAEQRWVNRGTLGEFMWSWCCLKHFCSLLWANPRGTSLLCPKRQRGKAADPNTALLRRRMWDMQVV